MKKLLLALTLSLIGLSSYAESYDVGLGLIIGAPTGLSGEVLLNGNRSLDFAAAWNTWHYTGIHVHADYLFNQPAYGRIEDVPFYWYYGLGGRAILIDRGDHKDKMAIGPRVPLGTYIQSTDHRFKFFGEVSAVLDIIPSTDIDLNAAIGARFYF